MKPHYEQMARHLWLYGGGYRLSDVRGNRAHRLWRTTEEHEATSRIPVEQSGRVWDDPRVVGWAVLSAQASP